MLSFHHILLIILLDLGVLQRDIKNCQKPMFVLEFGLQFGTADEEIKIKQVPPT